MAAGTLTQPKAPAALEATAPNRGTNRIDEHDADYTRLHSGTVARLQSSIRRYVRDLRASGHDAHRQMTAAQAFIQRHTALLRDAYAAGWREGHRDYYSGASASGGVPSGVTVAPPTSEQQGKRLSFYAPSVAKMAAEGLRALQAEHVAAKAGSPAKLVENMSSIILTGGHSPGYQQNRNNKGQWAVGDGGRQEASATGGGKVSVGKESGGGGGKGYHVLHTGAGGDVIHEEHNATLAKVNGYAKEQGVKERLTRAHFDVRDKEAAKKATPAELKAAAEERLKTAQARMATAEKDYQVAEKAAADKTNANRDEIARLYGVRGRAKDQAYRTRVAAREELAEQRARAKGEAGKAPKTYQKMLAAEQPMKEAKAAAETSKAAKEASEARWKELQNKYAPQYKGGKWNNHDQMAKDHADYKAAYRQMQADDSAAYRAHNAAFRKTATYEIARDKLAGKITDEDIAAHPLAAKAQARLDQVETQLGDVSGSADLFTASRARASAQAELETAEMGVKFPAWKYDLHNAPISPARFKSPDQWPAAELAAAKLAGNVKGAGKDPHVGDPSLGALEKAQGYDGKPDIVSEAELELYAKNGEAELWRGDSKLEHTDNLMAGDYHTGLGIRGNGTYAQDARYQGKSTAMSYAKDHSDGTIMRMTIKKGARVIDYADLKAQAHAAAQEAESAVKAAQASGDKDELAHARLLKWLATSDTSRFAVALGYDAVRILPQGQWIILNRTAVRVSHQVRDK